MRVAIAPSADLDAEETMQGAGESTTSGVSSSPFVMTDTDCGTPRSSHIACVRSAR